MRYFSTFSGIGGFELGIQLAYDNRPNLRNGIKDIQKDMPDTAEQSDRPTCIGFSEIDKYASVIYQKHFPNHKAYGDITKINAKDLPEFDLLVGGFPCQSFSIAGKRGGFSDTRGTMFFELARIIKEKQPRLCVFENVKGLLSHDQGNTFRTIIATLNELGYDCQWQVLNSKNHGVPQNRERVFIVGHLRGTPRPQVFPFGEDQQETAVSGVHTGTLTSRYPASQREGTYIEENGYRIREATKKGYAVAHEGDSINLSVPNSKTRRGRVGKGVAQTLDTGMQQHTLTADARIRRLTPVECERLQGFPDGWTEYGGYKKAKDVTDKNPEHILAFEKISDTQRYKTLGNAVTVNVIRDIFLRVL